MAGPTPPSEPRWAAASAEDFRWASGFPVQSMGSRLRARHGGRRRYRSPGRLERVPLGNEGTRERLIDGTRPRRRFWSSLRSRARPRQRERDRGVEPLFGDALRGVAEASAARQEGTKHSESTPHGEPRWSVHRVGIGRFDRYGTSKSNVRGAAVAVTRRRAVGEGLRGVCALQGAARVSGNASPGRS
jgi:hypothetical protein